MPDGYAGRDGNVEGMFGAELRQLDAVVAGVDHSLIHTVDFMAEHQRVFARRIHLKAFQRDALMGLFHGTQCPFRSKRAQGREGVGEVAPVHTVFGAEGRLVDFGRGGSGGKVGKG